ncbi:phosphatidate cytidylyltransferase [Butyrivibrio sp. AE2032]|uniref:phosphatidate cytidylyltransferase n=1 Tax=Butyrivibrio sp. AE2032 TaxID=1458463 RepID=UPI00068C248B|nr:phosphatidate cytidylyltransferase [Butyrivibrio sp. AE2032]
MRQRIITGIIFTVLVLSFFLPAYFWPVTAVVMSVIIGVCVCIEMYRALKHGGYRPSRSLLCIGMGLATLVMVCGLVFNLKVENTMALYLIIVCMYSVSCGINLPLVRPNDDKSFLNGMFTGGMVFYISFPLFCLDCAMLFLPHGWFYMVIGLFAPWATDTFAYFTGVAFGKHKIVPHISPKKTWEGCIGGSIFCAVAVTVYSCLVIYKVDNIEMGMVRYGIIMFLLGILISVMSQLGDWFCSVIKRRTGIKDFSNIFPGHGGMLDRFDSAFFTLPTALLLALIANNLF